MSLKLNDEQRKLVEQNHNLIYSAMTKCGIRRQDFDDYYGFAAIGLCKAAIDYDESKAKSFSTYAYKCMQKEIIAYTRWRFADKRDERLTLSYNQLMKDLDEDEKEYSFLLADKKNNEKKLIFFLCFDEQMRILNNKDRLIINLKAKGYTNEEIGNTLGVTYQAIQYQLKKIKNKLIPSL